MSELVVSFLRKVSGVTSTDPEEMVSVRGMLNRIGFVEDTDPDSAGWTVEALVERYGETIEFYRVAGVLMCIASDEIGAEWRAGYATFFHVSCEVLNNAMGEVFSFSGKVH